MPVTVAHHEHDTDRDGGEREEYNGGGAVWP